MLGARFTLVIKSPEEESISAIGFRCSLFLTSESGVRRFGERHDCVEEGLALPKEQAGVYQGRRWRNRSPGLGVAGPDDAVEAHALIRKREGFTDTRVSVP